MIPARLRLRRATGGASEVLLLEPRDADAARTGRRWSGRRASCRRARVLYDAAGQAVVEIGTRTAAGDTFVVTLLGDGDPLDTLAALGEMPLPPYIHTTLDDPERYQTVFADEPASAAAPTAGLHLTADVFAGLAARGIGWVDGRARRRPRHVRPDHRGGPVDPPHAQRALPGAATRRGPRSPTLGGSSPSARRRCGPWRAWPPRASSRGAPSCSSIPGGQPAVVDVLMTNFHLPRTTLLLMIEAFVGPRWRRLYADAAASGYRFLSFGDAMLLDRHAR